MYSRFYKNLINNQNRRLHFSTLEHGDTASAKEVVLSSRLYLQASYKNFVCLCGDSVLCELGLVNKLLTTLPVFSIWPKIMTSTDPVTRGNKPF